MCYKKVYKVQNHKTYYSICFNYNQTILLGTLNTHHKKCNTFWM